MISYGCDRCGATQALPGKVYRRPEGWSTIRAETSGGSDKTRKDIRAIEHTLSTALLCPDCTKSFNEWMHP